MARRAGRKGMGPNDLGKAARHMAGPTGELWSNGWEQMATNKDAYLKSFDKTISPSLFVSERDRTRLNQPIPMPERAIADVVADPAGKVTDADYEEAFRALDSELDVESLPVAETDTSPRPHDLDDPADDGPADDDPADDDSPPE